MSFHGYLYIGPTIKLGTPTKKFSVEVNACWNEKCEKYSKMVSSAFCATCGTAISIREFEEEKTIHFHDFVYSEDHDNEEWEESFIESEFETEGVLYPNDLSKDGYFYHDSVSEGVNIIFDEDFDARKAEQVERFTENYSDLLEMLKAFGFKDAEIIFVCKLYYS
jgi:hypothetical protein